MEVNVLTLALFLARPAAAAIVPLEAGAAPRPVPVLAAPAAALSPLTAASLPVLGPRFPAVSAGLAADGAPVEVARTLSRGVFTAVERRAETGAARASAEFRLEDGVLHARATEGRAAAPALLDKAAELARALALFGPGVRAVAARWEGADRGEFNALAASGLAPEEAASRTWVGERAARAGFTRVLFSPESRARLAAQTPGSHPGVAALFVRPEDVATDRAGAEWRRAEVRRRDGGTWERHESGSRAVWLRRYESDDESSVYEYGSARPRDGVPAERFAVFSLSGGRFSAFVRAAGPGLLDGRAAARAALARFGARATAVEARWGSGNGLAEFKRGLARGLPPEDAARRTWLGRLADETGFTKVVFAPGALEDLRAGRRGGARRLVVLFTRP